MYTSIPYRTRTFTHDGRGNVKQDVRTKGATTDTLDLIYGNGDRLIYMDVMYAGFAGAKTGQQRRCAVRRDAMKTYIKLALCLFLLCGLTACKIKLNIFSDDEEATDNVVSASGNFNCTNGDSPTSSGCYQEYKPVDQCTANDPDCTEIDTEAQFTEVFAANPDVPVFAPAKPVYITSL